jgi:hypothetical protein
MTSAVVLSSTAFLINTAFLISAMFLISSVLQTNTTVGGVPERIAAGADPRLDGTWLCADRARCGLRSPNRDRDRDSAPAAGPRPYRRSCFCLQLMQSVARGKTCSRALPIGSPQDSQMP